MCTYSLDFRRYAYYLLLLFHFFFLSVRRLRVNAFSPGLTCVRRRRTLRAPSHVLDYFYLTFFLILLFPTRAVRPRDCPENRVKQRAHRLRFLTFPSRHDAASVRPKAPLNINAYERARTLVTTRYVSETRADV